MRVNRIRPNVLSLLTAFIWGTAFVAQSVGARYMGPFTFNTLRAAIAFVFLLGLCAVRRAARRDIPDAAPASRRDLILGGLACGTALTVASAFQQMGLETTSSGKAGFLTALYIVLVPVLGLFLGNHPPRAVWASVVLAVAGLYCLCLTEAFTVTQGDFYLLLCALCFAVQILVIDHFQKIDGVSLSCAQFFVMTVLSVLGVFREPLPAPEMLLDCLWPVLYVGVFSSGVGYTLQILAQKDSDPAVVSLLLSMESVFAALAGAVLLHDRMSPRECLGCGLMLAAVILAQLPDRRVRKQI